MYSSLDDHINDGPLLLGPISSGRLKNVRDVDICEPLSVRGTSVIRELGVYWCSLDGTNSTLNLVVQGNGINTLYIVYNSEQQIHISGHNFMNYHNVGTQRSPIFDTCFSAF